MWSVANPIPSHVPPAQHSRLVVSLDELPADVREFARVLIVHKDRFGAETVSRIDDDGLVHFKTLPPVRGVPGHSTPPRPLNQVWVHMGSEDGRSLLVAALLPLLTTNYRKVRHYKWLRQDTRRVREPAWVAVGALYDQWIGPPEAGDVDHRVPGLRGDMGPTEALLHVWAWAKGRQA